MPRLWMLNQGSDAAARRTSIEASEDEKKVMRLMLD